ncbi:MAG: ester cyclase [Nannocystaceae bacterium]|nr:ester cyclase [Nannocystaceae bacterium]
MIRRHPLRPSRLFSVALLAVACDPGHAPPSGAKAKAPKPERPFAKFDSSSVEQADAKPTAKPPIERDTKADRPRTDEDAKMAADNRRTGAADEFAASRDQPAPPVTAKPGTPEWFVQGLAAFRAGDIDPIVANFALDIEWDAVGSPLEPPSKGKPAVLSRWEDLLTAIPDMKLHARRIFHHGELVVMQVVLTGTHKGDFRGIAATGKPLGAEVLAWIWHDASGKAKRVKVVYDEATLLAQMGQLGGGEAPPVPAIPDGDPEIIAADADAPASKTLQTMLAGGKKAWTLCETKLCSLPLVAHDTRMGSVNEDAAQHQAMHDAFFAAFPDMRVKLTDVTSFGAGWAVALVTMKGTHKADLGGMKATGKKVELAMTELVRLQDGKIAETWMYSNHLQLLAAVGMFTPPGAAAPK